MKLIHTKIDDDLADLLAKHPNQSEIVRQALRLYIEGIPTDTLRGLRASYATLLKLSREMDSKLDYISRKVQ